eukprot:6242224-Prymnesium_polylepis.1
MCLVYKATDHRFMPCDVRWSGVVYNHVQPYAVRVRYGAYGAVQLYCVLRSTALRRTALGYAYAVRATALTLELCYRLTRGSGGAPPPQPTLLSSFFKLFACTTRIRRRSEVQLYGFS